MEIFTDSDWAADKTTRKGTSGCIVYAHGCRLHSHSRGQDVVALSSCEAEVMAGSETTKEGLMLQHVLEFVGAGHFTSCLKMDSSSARSFMHRSGVGRMKHIDARVLWLQDLTSNKMLTTQKVERLKNFSTR